MAALTDLVRIAPEIGDLHGDEIKALLMPLNLDRYNIGDAIQASRVSTDALLAELRDASNNSV